MPPPLAPEALAAALTVEEFMKVVFGVAMTVTPAKVEAIAGSASAVWSVVVTLYASSRLTV